jgi:hypothetical protein
MAITPASFVPDQPEQRRVGMANTAENAPKTGAEDHAKFETPPASHPITGTNLPQSTGAGNGTVHKNLVH